MDLFRGKIFTMKTAARLAVSLVGLFATVSFLLADPPATSAPALPESVEVASVKLGEGVYLLRGTTKNSNPSTVIFIGPEGTVVVDPNMMSVGPAITREIERLGGGPVRYVFCTHYHGDHAEGMQYFGPQAAIITPHHQRSRLMTQAVDGDKEMLPPSAWPVMTFEGTFTLHLNGAEVQVATLPNLHGHTDGDAVIYFPAQKVLCVGDYLFVDKFPIIDIAEGGGDLEGYLANIRFLVAHFPADTQVVPGHGYFIPHPVEAVTMAKFAANLAALEKSIAEIRAHMTGGRTREQVIADGLPVEFASYDVRPRFVPIAKWIGFVYDYYAAKSPATKP